MGGVALHVCWMRVLRAEHGRAQRREVRAWSCKFWQQVELRSSGRRCHRGEGDRGILVHLVALLFQCAMLETVKLGGLLAHEVGWASMHFITIWSGRNVMRGRISMLRWVLKVLWVMRLRDWRLVHGLCEEVVGICHEVGLLSHILLASFHALHEVHLVVSTVARDCVAGQ